MRVAAHTTHPATLPITRRVGRMREWRERLLADSVLDDQGCWLWQGRIDEHGYARSTYGRELEQLAHRLSFRLFRGDIEEGLTLDHLCRVRHCVNPEHLEAVTLVENIMRGDGICARRARATHCQRGHACGKNIWGLNSCHTGNFIHGPVPNFPTWASAFDYFASFVQERWPGARTVWDLDGYCQCFGWGNRTSSFMARLGFGGGRLAYP